ncbi:hypothetical protein BC835DRAFT_1488319, partial [Cytidiella melzeri]
SVYFKASGLAARANDTTHLYGITMSHSWVYHLIEKLSENARQWMFTDILRYPFLGTHDNLNLAFKVYEQRTNNQSHFDSGTAATIYILKDPSVVWPQRESFLQRHQAQSCTIITPVEILRLELAAAPRLRIRAIYRVLQFLVNAPAFNFDNYEHKNAAIFSPPPPVLQLPTGKQHAVCQYMPDTVHIESASQAGTRQCMDEWLRQLCLDGPNAQDLPTYKYLLVWAGDQLTTVRIRSIKKDRSKDFNFFQRFRKFVEIFGWFHAQLAVETSIHRQYFKLMNLFGLKHAFDNLKRKGLHTTSIQGATQFRAWHIAEAQFRDIWLIVSNNNNIARLRTLSPPQLKEFATRIVDNYVSTSALVQHKALPRQEQDDMLLHSIQLCCDLLDYVDLDDTMKTGDVGRLEDLLPRLLFRFSGGPSSNYAIELLELLQGLRHEWTDELKSFVMRYCWLANTTGRKGTFLAFDMLQEHNIRDIKHIFAVHGPFSSWEYIKKISASIPAQRRIKEHVEEEFNHFWRGKSHTTPESENNITSLLGHYRQGKPGPHVHKPGRHLSSHPPNYVANGSNAQKLSAAIKRWSKKCVSLISTEEDFDEEGPVALADADTVVVV